MAASDSTPRTSSPADDAAESAAGMAHLTVVPANFDPDDSSVTDE
ncbi:hypothetical protein [Natrinema saccharevitans]|nr:hypothetical protein [Natrinema saccharevitans]